MTRRQIPSPIAKTAPVGCWASFVLFAVAGWGIGLAFPRLFALSILSTAPLGLALLHEAREARLVRTARTWAANSGRQGVLIYSDSPTWHQYIETRWLPRFGHSVAILNWSERRNWNQHDPLVRLFHAFVGTTYQYNPAVIVIRKKGRPLVFRFYQTFRNLKHGKPASLEALETEMFKALHGAVDAD